MVDYPCYMFEDIRDYIPVLLFFITLHILFYKKG